MSVPSQDFVVGLLTNFRAIQPEKRFFVKATYPWSDRLARSIRSTARRGN
jgi:hypothetical protein